MPTADLRSLFRGVLAEQLGLDAAFIDRSVFPASAAVAPFTGLVCS